MGVNYFAKPDPSPKNLTQLAEWESSGILFSSSLKYESRQEVNPGVLLSGEIATFQDLMGFDELSDYTHRQHLNIARKDGAVKRGRR